MTGFFPVPLLTRLVWRQAIRMTVAALLAYLGTVWLGLAEGYWAVKGDIRTVASLRANIKKVAANSGIAREEWIKDTSLDAWITWTIWQVSNPTLADRVPIVEEYQIYRDCWVGLTNRGKNSSTAHQFIDFLKSQEGARIFKHWGWETAAGL